MGGRHHTPDQIVGKLREAERRLGKGQTAREICRGLGVTEQTYYRWRKLYGGTRGDLARRIAELEAENGRLRKLIAEQALRDSMRGDFEPADG